MKSRFFNKKSKPLPQSASCDSQLCDARQQHQQQHGHHQSQIQEQHNFSPLNNSIDKSASNSRLLFNSFVGGDSGAGCSSSSGSGSIGFASASNPTTASAHRQQQQQQHHLALLQPSLCQLSPMASTECSSTQGIIGCANELFDVPSSKQTTLAMANQHWHGGGGVGGEFPVQMKLLAAAERRKRRPITMVDKGNGLFEDSDATAAAVNDNCSALIKCHEMTAASPLIGAHRTSRQIANAGGQSQVADLVFTLAQQLAGKDAEICRLRGHLKKSECRAQRAYGECEKELERKGDELDAAREQIGRMRKRLKAAEMEAAIAERVNQRIGGANSSSTKQIGANGTHQEAMAAAEAAASRWEVERDRLIAENGQLKLRLTQELQMQSDREMEWERERKELKQSVQSLNASMEELESELRQREVKEREMQLELESAMVQREIAKMGLMAANARANANSNGNRKCPREQEEEEEQQQQSKRTSQEQNNAQMPVLDLPSPNRTDSSSFDGPFSVSATSSSGFGSVVLNKDQSECSQKDLNRALALARRRLAECRVKIGHLLKTAEKAQRGERLNGEDLFGVSPLPNEDDCSPRPSSITASVEEHGKQIGIIRKELELLHDKFTILYARGTIGH